MSTEPRGNRNADKDVEMGETMDEEVREDVFSDLDGWYGIMIHVLLPILVHANFTFPCTVEGFFRQIRG